MSKEITNPQTFIGENEVESVATTGDGKVKIKFKGDHPEIDLNKRLYYLVKSDNKRTGTVVDIVNHVLATKYLSELAEYDLDYYMVDNVANAMGVLAHNLREQLLKETFNCSGGDAMKLKLLVKSDD